MKLLLESLLILFAAIITGNGFVNKYKKQIEELQMYKQVLLMMSGEIRVNQASLYDSFIQISERINGLFHMLLCNTAHQLEKKEGKPFADIWKEQLGLLKEQTGCFEKEDLFLIAEFGEQLGYLDRQMQIEMIAQLQEKTEERIKKLKSTYEKRTYLCRVCTICAGIFVIILRI